MNTEIWLAIIGVIEVAVAALMPTMVEKVSKKNARKNDRKKFLLYFARKSDNSEIEKDINQILDQTIEVARSLDCWITLNQSPLREYVNFCILFTSKLSSLKVEKGDTWLIKPSIANFRCRTLYGSYPMSVFLRTVLLETTRLVVIFYWQKKLGQFGGLPQTVTKMWHVLLVYGTSTTRISARS